MPKSKKKNFLHNFIFAFIGFWVAFFVINQVIDLNPKWNEPAKVFSQNGLLDFILEAKKQQVDIGGSKKDSMVWNDRYIAQTWDIKGGDTVKVHLKNQLDQPTNLHFHGSHVSPKGNSDNVLLTIHPGETFDYEYKLPEDHPPGLYWYHPHLHHYVDDQVEGGMAGAIIVRGDIDELPGIKGVPEKLLVLTTQEDPKNENDVIRLVNNQVNPTLYVRPFETVRLRILNASADDFYDFAIPGQKLNIISRDGNTLAHVESVDSELLAPGDRVELLFKAGSWGEMDVKSIKYAQGFFTYPEATFMKIKVAGIPVLPKDLPTTLIPYDNFKDAKIDNVRTLTFSEGGTDNNPTFLLDGKMFDPDVISQIMTLGTTEEWHLINNSGETHPFHIHINPFQVVSVDGIEIDRPGLDDTFPVPANSTVVIRTKYRDFDGKYVLHCHILFHEDHGMMQVVEVVKPGATPAPDNGVPDREGMVMDHILIDHAH